MRENQPHKDIREAQTLQLLKFWDRGDFSKRLRLSRELPTLLLQVNRIEEAFKVYAEAAAQDGLPLSNLLVENAQSQLRQSEPELAASLYQRDRNSFNRALQKAEATGVEIGTPSIDATGKGLNAGAATTLAADNVGASALVFAAEITQTSSAARYRFEFGLTRELDQATAWKPLPPPLNSWAYQPLYRHIGEWLPTCVNAGWRSQDVHGAQIADPLLAIGAPFSKDRNQLNGIGPHEMPVGVCWSRSAVRVAALGEGNVCWPITGGEQDLRDAEISFRVGGDRLEQHGATLHFWASHVDHDDLGWFTSQWALTAAPIPDDILGSAEPRRITLTLRNTPETWTYTGNNPVEERERANRYRRSSLDTTLSHHNASTVLIFSFGDVRHPPTGTLLLQDVEVHCRNASVLSPAAGASLVRFPAGPVDPLRLTAGRRGYDDHLWTSALAPAFPLEFRWTLRTPVAITHFQISQHPYWPAQDIEVVAEDRDGIRCLLWSGALPEGRPDQGQPSHIVHHVAPERPATAIILRILSSYHAERCGLDAVEVYGEGATFDPDGRGCTVSTEVEGLAPGSTVFYRAVLDDGGEKIFGATHAIPLPARPTPLFHWVKPLVRRREPACYVVRVNAMGSETRMWGELEDAGGRVFRGPVVSLGSQPTGRHTYYTPVGIPCASGIFRLHAENAAGSAVIEAPWPITEEA